MRGIDAKHISSAQPAGERGFTIVEVVVAVSILLTGLLSLVGLFDDSRDQNATGERSEIALMQAEQAIEELRGMPYANLMLSEGAVDPTGGQRVLSGGSQFKVTTAKTEPLVYYSTEGGSLSNAWVDPVSEVEIGGEDNPLGLTIYRFVSWRDEECGLTDLDTLGLELPNSINGLQIPLSNLVNNVLQTLLGLVSGSANNTLNTLRNRLDGLENALLGREPQLASAIAGISELDLCDLSISALEDLQQLGHLNPGIAATGGLTDDLEALESSLSGICLPIVGCVLGQAQNTAISGVHSQLNCLFGSTTDTEAEFDAYLAGVLGGLNDLAGDVSDTVKNSKRVTVAVVVEPRNGVAPIQPVWMTSVVRDPSAGLLSPGSTSCQ